MYEVIRECPSLIDKVNHIVDVWRNRGVISPERLAAVEDAIKQALYDYSHNVVQPPKPPQPFAAETANSLGDLSDPSLRPMSDDVSGANTFDIEVEQNSLSDDFSAQVFLFSDS